MSPARGCDTDECCQNDAWRGRLCPYHQGYDDGYEAGDAMDSFNEPIRDSTHWAECWRAHGHHACAIAILDRILASDTWAAQCDDLGCHDDHFTGGAV